MPQGARFGHDSQMRKFRLDTQAKPGWYAEWALQDLHEAMPFGADLRFRHYDLTPDAAAGTCEGWISTGHFNDHGEGWIPRVMIRRQAAAKHAADLQSTFIGVMTAYEGHCPIRSVRCLALTGARGKKAPDSVVAVEVTLRRGAQQLLILDDPENPGTWRQAAWDIRSAGQLNLHPAPPMARQSPTL